MSGCMAGDARNVSALRGAQSRPGGTPGSKAPAAAAGPAQTGCGSFTQRHRASFSADAKGQCIKLRPHQCLAGSLARIVNAWLGPILLCCWTTFPCIGNSDVAGYMMQLSDSSSKGGLPGAYCSQHESCRLHEMVQLTATIACSVASDAGASKVCSCKGSVLLLLELPLPFARCLGLLLVTLLW